MEYRRLLNEFEVGGFMAQKGLWKFRQRENAAGQRCLSQEEGDVGREYKATHEENFLSSWTMEKATFGRPCFGKKSGQARRNIDLVQEVLSLCQTEDGTKIAELLQARTSGHQEHCKNPDS